MKDQPTQYDAEISELNNQIHDLTEKRNELERLRAHELCPFKIGDTLINKKDEKAILDRIMSRWSGYEMKGRFIKKNGEPGSMERDLYSWDDWKLA